MRTRTSSSVGDPVTLTETVRYISTSYDSFCNVTNVSDSSNNYSVTVCPSTYSKSITDVVTPNFKKLQRQGYIFNNPCSIVTTLSKASPISWDADSCNYNNCGVHFRTINFGELRWDNYYGNPHLASSYTSKINSMPDVNIERLKATAITDAYSKIDLSEAALLATFGEFKESIASIASIIARVIRIFKAIRRLDLKALAGEITPKELANRYMEYRYALRPLVYDAKQILSAMQASQRDFSAKRQTFRSRLSDSKQSTDLTHYATPGGAARVYFATLVRQDVEVSSGVLTDIEFLTNYNIWGLDQIIETAWELTPFSFIADWFFNIGKTLASWTPEAGVRELAAWVTVKNTMTHLASVGAIDASISNYDHSMVKCSGNAELIVTTYSRTPNPNRDILPSFSLKLDGWKILDLGIILKKLLS